MGSELHGISVSPNVRKLNKGFTWQRYIIIATKYIKNTEFALEYGSSSKEMHRHREKWENAVLSYIFRRCDELGMYTETVKASCQEEPDSEKPMEKVIWESADLAFVWSVWAYIKGPIKEEYWREEPLPIEGFWPRTVRLLQGDIAEIMDAEVMLGVEQGWLNKTT